MKRRFPGDQVGPPGRTLDPRFPSSRGNRGSPGNQMGRGPPHGRGVARPPYGRGGPGMMMGRGAPARGIPRTNAFARGPPNLGTGIGRGVPQRPPFMRAPMGGRHPSAPRIGGSGGRSVMPRSVPFPPPPPPPHNHHGPGMHQLRIPPPPPPPPSNPAFRKQQPPIIFAPPLTNLPPPPLSRPNPVPATPIGPSLSFSVQATPTQKPQSSYLGFQSGVQGAAAASNHTTLGQQNSSTGATTAPPTLKQIDDAWTEHTAPSGVKYYHNRILKESTYTKPDSFGKTEIVDDVRTKQWKEYEDETTGKKYYSDGITTTWEKPATYRSPAEDTSLESHSALPPKKKKKAALDDSPYGTKEEAVTGFKDFLLSKGIVPNQKWNDLVKYCSSDKRWEVFEGILSVGERKQALAEYQTKRANELRDKERQERARAKDAYGQLLTDILPTVSSFSAWKSRFSDVRSSLAKDDRFHAVADEGTRESLFMDFCEEFRKRDERKKRDRKRETQELFCSFLDEKRDAGFLTFATTWDSFMADLKDTEREDKRFRLSNEFHESDRQLYFADYVIELQAAEDDKRRRIRDARRRAEKAQRDTYRDALKRLSIEGRIRPHTRWRTIEEFVTADDSFQPVQAQNNDAPRELFEEFVDQWDDVYRREWSFVDQVCQKNGDKVTINVDMTLEDFTKMLLQKAAYSSDISGEIRRIITKDEPVSTARLYYEELISKLNMTSDSRRRLQNNDSSEDEGEIIEDEE